MTCPQCALLCAATDLLCVPACLPVCLSPQLTKPVFEMLDRVTAIGTNDLASAQELVANVSSSVQKMSDSIQSATVDKIDNFQSSYLGKSANSSAQAAVSSKSNPVKAVHAVYYVSAHGWLFVSCKQAGVFIDQLMGPYPHPSHAHCQETTVCQLQPS